MWKLIKALKAFTQKIQKKKVKFMETELDRDINDRWVNDVVIL